MQVPGLLGKQTMPMHVGIRCDIIAHRVQACSVACELTVLCLLDRGVVYAFSTGAVPKQVPRATKVLTLATMSVSGLCLITLAALAMQTLQQRKQFKKTQLRGTARHQLQVTKHLQH